MNDNTIKTSLSVSMKVNLGNYESADAFVCLSDVPVGATAEEIKEALETGKLAWSILRKRILEQAADLRKTAREYA